MLIRDVYQKWKFCRDSDRLGPDMPFTHWKLYFKSTMTSICRRKFKIFGENADFRAGAYAIHTLNISLGKNVVIRPTSMLFADSYAEIAIEDNVMLGSGVHCYVSNHRFDRRDIPLIEQGHYKSKSVLIKAGAWVGANTIILPGVTIGINAVVGAGSIVTKDVNDYTVVAGNPAKVISMVAV